MTLVGSTAYLLATAGTAAYLHPRWHHRRVLWLTTPCFALPALVLHGCVLYQGVFTEQGVDLGFFNALLLISWLLTALIMSATLLGSVSNLLALFYPVSALLLILQALFHERYLLSDVLTTGMQIHIVLSVLAYSLLAFAVLQSLLLYLQHQALRHKHIRHIHEFLPPLQTMEKLLMRFILAGFFLLSLSLTSGLMFVHDVFAQHLAHKTLLSILAWCIYGILLWGHWRAGWRGVTITKWAIGGFILLALAYFGSKLALELVLDRR